VSIREKMLMDRQTAARRGPSPTCRLATLLSPCHGTKSNLHTAGGRVIVICVYLFDCRNSVARRAPLTLPGEGQSTFQPRFHDELLESCYKTPFQSCHGRLAMLHSTCMER
jgi:hypothetical protein